MNEEIKDANGHIKRIHYSIDGKHRACEEWNENNIKIAHFQEVQNGESWVYDGTYTLWDKNGLLSIKSEFREGIRDGLCLIYNVGQLYVSYSFFNDKLHGRQSIYSTLGRVVSYYTWMDGMLHGENVTYLKMGDRRGWCWEGKWCTKEKFTANLTFIFHTLHTYLRNKDLISVVLGYAGYNE